MEDYLIEDGEPAECNTYSIFYTFVDGQTVVDPPCLTYNPTANEVTATFPGGVCIPGTVFYATLCLGDVCGPFFKIRYGTC